MESSKALEGVTQVTIPHFDEFFQAEHVRLARAPTFSPAADADELTHEAMVRVHERWDRVRQMASPHGYLFRAALNLHRSWFRRLASRARLVLDVTPSPDPAEVVESRDRITRALASLPIGQRGAVVLVDWPGSVRAGLSRAKGALRQLQEDEDA